MTAVEGECPKLPQNATIYVLSVVAIGVATMLEALYSWTCPDLRRFFAYLVLAMIGGALKVRLPRMPGTFSLSYLVLLMSIADLNYSESIVIGALSTFVQCLWNARPRPTAAQMLFNIANFTISIAVCCVVVESALLHTLQRNVAAELALITCIFFTVNTLFVSGIIAILQKQHILKVWRSWFMWSFPYYLIGATVAGLEVAAGRAYGWQSALLMLPVMLFVYLYYRIYMSRQRRELAT